MQNKQTARMVENAREQVAIVVRISREGGAKQLLQRQYLHDWSSFDCASSNLEVEGVCRC